jgi:hypothetical protein
MHQTCYIYNLQVPLKDMVKTSANWLVEPTNLVVMYPVKIFNLIKLDIFQCVQ